MEAGEDVAGEEGLDAQGGGGRSEPRRSSDYGGAAPAREETRGERRAAGGWQCGARVLLRAREGRQ